MSLTRAALREKGITEKEILDYIMEEHGVGIENAKEKTEEATKKAMQKTIDALQERIDNAPKPETDDESWKSKYDALKSSFDALQGEFDTYKQTTEAEKITASKRTALRGSLKNEGVNEKLIELLETKFDIDNIEIDGGKIKDWDELIKPIKERFSEVFGTVHEIGANPASPPKVQQEPQDLFIAGFDGN